MTPASFLNNPYLTEEQKRQMASGQRLQNFPAPAPVLPPALPTTAASPMEAQWQNKMAPPPLTFGGVPGAEGMSQAAMVQAGALGAPPPGRAPMMPGAPPPQKGNPMWYDAMTKGMGMAGIGAATGSPIGLGVGAGLGVLSEFMKRRREQAANRPFSERMSVGGLIKQKPREPIRLAAGGAAKQRQGYPRTVAPKVKGNPFLGSAKGGGKATRGMKFKTT